MNKFFRCLRKLKMNQQVTIFGFLIMSLVLLIILGTWIVQTTILFNIVQSSSEMITIKQERRSIERASSRIKDYLQRKYFQSVHNVQHIERFFGKTLDIQEREYKMSANLFPSCAKQAGGHRKSNIKYDTNLFCYQSLLNSDGITIPNNDPQIDFFKFTVSLLSQYSLIFDVSNETQLFIFDLPKTQMMITYPQNYQPNNYSISRTWFQNYRNELLANPNEIYYYSPIYFSAITNELNMAVVATILDQSGLPIGFSAQSILLSDQNIESIPINIILASDNGEILFSSIDSISDAQEQIYVYNKTYTGFNETDWNLIQDYSNHGNLSLYTCNGFINTFCLYNKYYNTTVQVDALDFQQENFTLIVFINVTYQTDLTLQFSQLTGKLQSLILQIELIAITASFAMLLITAVLIQILFLPLFQLMMNIKLHLKGLGNNIDRQIFTMTRRLNHRSNIFSNLNIRFMNLQDILAKSQITKSSLCLQIEQFTYNRNKNKVEILKIKQNVSKLIDQYNTPHEVLKSSLNQFYQKL